MFYFEALDAALQRECLMSAAMLVTASRINFRLPKNHSTVNDLSTFPTHFLAIELPLLNK